MKGTGREMDKAEGTCRWFLMCTRRAVTTVPHPILGDVPVCQKCADWCKRMGA